jgi:hypothetical protein
MSECGIVEACFTSLSIKSLGSPRQDATQAFLMFGFSVDLELQQLCMYKMELNRREENRTKE